MNTQREVFNKLFKEEKTELATQKIELAAPQFKEFGQKAQSIYLDARNLAQKELMNLKQSLEKGDSKLISLENDLDSAISKVEKTAKEIGVDIYSTKVGQSIKTAKSELKSYVDSFSKAITKAKGLKL
tara:strand:+ start:385 stop:768 length:384 start_codon:yes stop_codon:yes gene_type:complete